MSGGRRKQGNPHTDHFIDHHALDLVIFSDLALRAGMCGIQTWLSFFCKSPMHDFEHEPVHDLFQQWRMVKETLRNMVGETAPSYLD
jgi:myo-inositol-1-phosphate synthase